MKRFSKATLAAVSTFFLISGSLYAENSSGAKTTPKGWEEGREGPIFLRVQLSESAAAPIFLTGNAGWRYPRRLFSFTLGDDKLPVFRADDADGEMRKPPGEHQWQIRPGQSLLQPEQTGQYIQPGGHSQWVELPPAALDRDWLNQIALGYPEKIILLDNDLVTNPDSEITIEIASQPDPAAIVRRVSSRIGPNHPVAAFLLHRGLEQPVIRKAAEIAMETQEQVRKLLDENAAFGKRPEKFPVSIGFVSLRNELPGLWQGVLPRDAWEIELQTLEMLGINGLHWQMGPELRERGFVNNAIQAYYWPSFPPEEDVENFVKDVAQRITDADAWDDVVSMSTFEENGGPDMEALIGGDKAHSAGEYREYFLDYLKQRGIRPEDLGKKSWEEVRIVSVAEAEKEPELFYHSALFRPWVITHTVSQVADHASRHFRKPLMHGVFTSDAYVRSGSMLRQGVDLFRWIREAPGVADLSSEGWKNLSATYEFIAWEMAVARAAARYKEHPRPGFLNILRRTPTDIELAVYVALSQGANHIYHFGWGPWYAQSDSASDRPEIAPPIRKSSHAIGALEDLLVSDHVRPAETAILYSFPTDAWSWVKYDRSPFWIYENKGVFLSLAHQQIPSDLLIDEDILRGELSKYKVLYVVGPNMDSAVAKRIGEWVKQGGVLAATAGAATRDQYDRPLHALNEVFGAVQGAVKIDPAFDVSINLARHPWLRERFVPPGEETPFPIGGAHVALEPQGASILAKLRDGGAAMTEHAHGKGRAYLMGGTLGFTYLQDAVKRKERKANSRIYQDSYNPVEFSEAIRSVINLPAVKAGVRRPVEIDAPGVHAGLREGPEGAVIVLVNYPRKEWEDMSIRINGIPSGRIARVFSTSLGKELDFQLLDENSAQIHLPRLSLTDMIGIHFK